MNTASPKRGPKSGLSLVEMTLGVTLLLLSSGTLLMVIQSLRRISSTNENQASLQTMADDALLDIVGDLRRSGSVNLGGAAYPYVFDGGEPDPAFAVHAHEPAAGTSEAGDDDFGPDREVVLLLPADADADGRPDVDGDGRLVWDPEEISFTVRTGADGVNRLERRVDGAAPVVVARHVERLVIDTSESSGFAIPLDSIRVRIFFRKLYGDGRLLRYSNEAVVALRNG